MAKNNFLLVDLNQKKTKKLAETITSETSRKILNYLTEKDDSEANIAKVLSIPISTVHYHLQKLKEAGLVVAEEFHYSQKGKEVNHYKLANKYIIIAPKKVSGLKEKLKGILPVTLVAVGVSAVIKLITSFSGRTLESGKLLATRGTFAADAMVENAEEVAPVLAERVVEETIPVVTQQPDIALWFLLGSLATIVIYLILGMIKELIKKR